MESDRWRLVERIVQEALARPDAERAAFLDEACAGDAALRGEVGSLLDFEPPARDFLEAPALELALARQPAPTPLPFDIGGYRLLALVGAGGMGEVYRARDLKLGRDVALKLLERSGEDPTPDFERFEEEARLASVLNHPNIVTIYGVGAEGRHGYIAMELVNGRTLRQILRGGALPVATALDFAVQLADAMAAAHEAGVAHRDLKPENIMITPGGLLKVLDFGIARRTRAAMGPRGAEGVAIAGTAGYMSPEQAEGRPAGAPSDQFSFGVIVCEMLTGARPFDRATRAATLAAIVHEEPAPVAALASRAAAPLARSVERCLAKRPEARYADTRELSGELRAARASWERRQAPTRRAFLWLGSAAAVAAAAAGAWKAWPRPGGLRSLAVLPFVNAARDEDAEHLCAGLTSALIERIAPLPSLTVMSHSLVLNFKDRLIDPRQVGRELGVDAVLAGSLALRAGRLLVTAELVEVASGRSLWTRSYDREAGDLLSLEDEIARAVVDDGMGLRVSGDDRRALARAPTSDPVAYDEYLRAVHLNGRENEDDYLRARALLQQAIARDPRFTEAYIAQAATYAAMAIDGWERPTEAWPHSSVSIRHALDLDPDLPDAHASAASFEFFFNWHWEGAEREWERAMRPGAASLHPDLLTARALQQWALGRADEALRLVRLARGLDRLSPMYTVREADYLVHSGRLDEAADIYAGLVRSHREDPRAYFGLAEVRRRQGRFDEAIAWRRRAHAAAGDDSMERPSAGGAEGYRQIEAAAAQWQVAALSERLDAGRYVSPLDLARAHAQLGQRGAAFDYLERSFTDRAPGLVFLDVDRSWDGLRDEPAFRWARRRVGLPYNGKWAQPLNPRRHP